MGGFYTGKINAGGGIVFTSATAPAASAVPAGTVITLSDYRYSRWYSDGTYYRPVGGEQLIFATATDCDAITSGTGEVQLAIATVGITATIPAILMAPSMEIRQSHSLIKTGTAGTVTQRIRRTNVAGGTLGYTTSLVATTLGARASMLLAAGGVSGGNIQLTNVMTGTTTAEVGSATAANISITQAIASPLVLFPTIQNANAGDSTVVRSFKVSIRG